MKFQVINKDGMPVMCTEHKSCIPTASELQSMQKAGYKFKIDGKNVTIKKLKEITNDC